MTFTAGHYDAIRAGCRSSAEVVAPMIDLAPGRMIDVGCGEGWWALAFAGLGWEVTGLDAQCDHQLGDRFIGVDLIEPLPSGVYDLAVCLEVAEHLPLNRARSFIAELCRLAPVVLFSAAVPHQTGLGHINCQWPSWWADLFAEHGYGCDVTLRWDIWTDDRVEPWYRQNVMVATSRGATVGPLDVVHPIVHEWGR